MLSKLMKHEFKATYKTFSTIYATLLLVSVLCLVMSEFEVNNAVYDVLSILLTVAYTIGIAIVSTLSTVLIINRFNKNLLGDEGYLMHTLPVSKGNLILSKWLVAGVWTIATTIIAMLAIFILMASEIPYGEIIETVKSIYNAYDNFVPLILVVFITCIVVVMEQIILIFTAISIGQLWSKHKVLGAFIAYFVIYFIESTIVERVSTLFAASKMEELNGTMESVNLATIDNALMDLGDFLISYMSVFALVCMAFSTIYFFICRFMLSHKLNLE